MISPYIQSIKEWKIREMVIGLLEAKSIFDKHNKPAAEMISFAVLRKICDFLYDIKENHHLIFKKIINPKKHLFENANKYTPNESEISFMNNVGLLFHKVMVARELKYILDYYTEDSNSYQETKASLDRNLQRIAMLFNQGTAILLNMLKSHTNNIYLLTYFLENQEFCANQFKQNIETLLKILTGEGSLEDAYFSSARYYAKSGWIEKARNACQTVLKLNPDNRQAIALLKEL